MSACCRPATIAFPSSVGSRAPEWFNIVGYDSRRLAAWRGARLIQIPGLRGNRGKRVVIVSSYDRIRWAGSVSTSWPPARALRASADGGGLHHRQPGRSQSVPAKRAVLITVAQNVNFALQDCQQGLLIAYQTPVVNAMLRVRQQRLPELDKPCLSPPRQQAHICPPST